MHDAIDTESVIREAERLLGEGDPQVARSILAPYVAQRVPAALFLYSSVSAPGEDIEAFERRSYEMLSEAAELGHVPAITALAKCFDIGDRVEQDCQRAAILFEQAAACGHPQAKLYHGLNLFYGSNGIKPDRKEAIRLLQEAEVEGVQDERTALR
ncbi:hypothetical protein A7D27_12120 [Pseudomonas sp. 1D4]|uniref:tetratricopeptide repeat protein n=1 Tax=Pseudomonadaceae TaxID=135621 RepID=UPI00084AA583|nr:MULTISPECIES: SEL1-like repeat protein [Pseudomonas]OEC42316.1 hypothetical protein A7D27_12120 [Pseudomonas sp. 1D4]